jgi:hypothetical protein
MTAAKKQTSSSPVPARVRRLISWLSGGGRPWVFLAVLLGLFLGGWYLTWRSVQKKMLQSAEYRVGPQQIEITPLPPWIQSNIVEDVLRDPTLDGPLGILDKDLAERIAKAFSRHPWVAKVVKVEKKHPARVCVELVYRKPVCMVDVSGEFLPVSAEGILLPREDFTATEAARYPRLVGVERLPAVSPGNLWGGDAKVIGGAEIAAVLAPVWERMKLQRIEPLASDPAAGAVGLDAGRQIQEPFFCVYTFGGTRILWGHAPGAKMRDELSPVEKLGRLQRYMADNDTFDGHPGQREIDIRKLLPSVGP